MGNKTKLYDIFSRRYRYRGSINKHYRSTGKKSTIFIAKYLMRTQRIRKILLHGNVVS